MARHAPELACPRCGYDVSGAVPTWTEACPLGGTCSECGAALDWPTVFNPKLGCNLRFVEHCRWRSVVVAAMRTWLWALWPPLFWKRVRPEMPVVMHRWVVWLVIIWLAPRVIVGSVDAGAAAIGLNRGTTISTRPVSEVTAAFLNGLLGPGVSVGMESFEGWYHPNWAPIAGSTNQPPGGIHAGVPIRLHVIWGLRLQYPVSQWWKSGVVPPGLPAALVFSAAMAAGMTLVWLRASGPHQRWSRFSRMVVFSVSWLALLNWLDLFSAGERLAGALHRPLAAAPPPVPVGITVSDLWPPQPDSMYHASTMLHWIERSAGSEVLMVGVLWTILWWWCAARAAFGGKMPVKVIICFGLVAAVLAAAVVLWNFDGLGQYWAWY